MNWIEKLALWYRLSSAKYLGPVRFRRLLDELGDGIGGVFDMRDEELLRLPGLTQQVIEGIRGQSTAEKASEAVSFAEEQTRRAEQCGGQILLLDDPLYPQMLRKSKMCHAIVYCRGDAEEFTRFDRSIAIVGTREAAKQSLKVAHRCASELSSEGWVVVSGLAKGVDSAAHEGAIAAGGGTIAVLGCGPDVVYPPEAADLYETILAKGLVLSEYPFGTRVNQLQLKKRNKTTVALSSLVFLVESSAKGGAMNAVRASKEQGKGVVTILPMWSGEFSGNLSVAESGWPFAGEAAQVMPDRVMPVDKSVISCLRRNLQAVASSHEE